MEQLSISEARNQLTRLAIHIQKDKEPIEVTNHGKPVMAILAWDLFEGMEETIEILSDEKLMARLHTSIKEMKQNRLISWDKAQRRLLKK